MRGKRTKLVPSLESRRPLVDLGRKGLEYANGDVAVLKREGFTYIPAGCVDASGVRAKVAGRSNQSQSGPRRSVILFRHSLQAEIHVLRRVDSLAGEEKLGESNSRL